MDKAVLPAVQLYPAFAHIAGGADGAALDARVHPDQGADANQGDHCTHTQRNTHDFTHRLDPVVDDGFLCLRKKNFHRPLIAAASQRVDDTVHHRIGLFDREVIL